MGYSLWGRKELDTTERRTRSLSPSVLTPPVPVLLGFAKGNVKLSCS